MASISDLRLMERVCKFTLMVFRTNEDTPKISIIRLAVCLLLLLLDTYTTGYILFISIQSVSNSFFEAVHLSIWSSKYYLPLIFMIYWQFGHFQRLLSPQTWPSCFSKRPPTQWLVYVLFGVLFSHSLFLNIQAFLSYYAPNWAVFKLSSHKMYDGFGTGFGGLSMLLIKHMTIVWFATLLFYTLVLRSLHQHLVDFNLGLKEIGLQSKNQEELALELETHHKRLKKIVSLIETVDSVFEVYAFVAVGASILTEVFNLVIIPRFFAKSPLIGALGISNSLMCALEVAVLTSYPIRIHSQIKQIEKRVLANHAIWFPHNERIYQIANSIIAQSKQEDLGLSLWSFSLITKPMILTVSSLIFTYIFLAKQLDTGASYSNQTSDTVYAIGL